MKTITTSLKNYFIFMLMLILFKQFAICCVNVFVYFNCIANKEDNINLYEILGLSLVFDLYMHQFIGMSFIWLSILYVFTTKYVRFFRDIKVYSRTLYFLLLLCACEIFVFTMTLLLGGHYNTNHHARLIIVSIAMYVACEIIIGAAHQMRRLHD